jgi:D-arabinose 1-dehydrogenase-like Zn-dependent alcohol dehydrogenase
VVGAYLESLGVPTIKILLASNSIQGWNSGSSIDSEDTLRFAEYSGVRPMIEKYPLEKAAEAYTRMMSGRAEFRVVLTM